eukprot:473478-Rhodomonas_salina.1
MAFFAAFLGKGLGVPAGSKFPVVGSIDGVDIDWSLGAPRSPPSSSSLSRAVRHASRPRVLCPA